MRKDSEWGVIDGEPCKVIEFTPLATIENGKVAASNKTDPYALVILECKKIPQQIKGFICHKMDFQHLWAAFKERGIQQNEEVIIFYSKKQLKSYAKIFSVFMPRLWVMICQKGAFELMTEEIKSRIDSNSKPKLSSEAQWNAMKPIVEWKPEVTK